MEKDYFYNSFKTYLYEANLIYLLKNIRNKIQYEGFLPEKEFIQRNELEFKHIISLLKSLILK